MRVLITYANAGGGHRSVALALQEAFRRYYPQVSTSLLDVMTDYAPFPLRQFPQLYPRLTRGDAFLWKWIYTMTDGPVQARVIARSWNIMVHQRLRTALRDYPADVIVSVYPLLNRNIGRCLHRLPNRPVFSILVTDLGTAHSLWFSRDADYYLVPTEQVYRRALLWGVPPDAISTVGLPVSLAFDNKQGDQAVLRRQLGLHPKMSMVLLLGGAEGMGGLLPIAQAIVARRPHAQLVIITGRNEKLRARLDAQKWRIPVKVVGYTDKMHQWMRAADLLLSKAGPSTISEALATGLPLVLTGYLPGQEEANIRFVVDSGAGVYQSAPEEIAHLVQLWTTPGNPVLQEMAAHARQAGRQEAAKNAVDILYDLGENAQSLLRRHWGPPYKHAKGAKFFDRIASVTRNAL